MCGCNQKRKPPTRTPSSTLTSSGNFTQDSIAKVVQSDDKSQMVVVEYVGKLSETFSIRSRVDRSIIYRFGNNEAHRTRTVLLADAEFLLAQRDAENRQNYRIVGTGTVSEVNDPSAFIGQPIAA